MPAFGASIVWVTGVAAIGLLAWRIGSGMPIPGAEDREDANLVATRPGATIRRWIVAHVDSKAQGHSMAGRVLAAWLLIGATIVLSWLALVRWRTGSPPANGWVVLGAGLAVIAGALASRGQLQGGSAGARDNGTGLLAALVAAELAHDPSVGFLFTGAEEFGLVGARVFLRSALWRGAAEVINVDTIDQSGRLYLVSHNDAGRQLAGRMRAQLTPSAFPIVLRSLPLGILVDSLPFARRGAAAITIARLDWSTLRLIHTAADTPTGLDLDTAEQVGGCLGRWAPPGAIG